MAPGPCSSSGKGPRGKTEPLLARLAAEGALDAADDDTGVRLVNLGHAGVRVLLPGFVNAHVHAAQQLGRGIADDVDLLTWLHERIWPYESTMNREEHFFSALACCLELLKSGVTTFAEAGGPWPEAEAKAVELAGLRCCLARSTMDGGEGVPAAWRETTDECLAKQAALYDRFDGSAGGRLRVWFGLRQILNNSDELVRRTREEAQRRGTGVHMHVSEIAFENRFVREHRAAQGETQAGAEAGAEAEVGKSQGVHPADGGRGGTVRHLERLGCLYPGLLCAHSVWCDDGEVAALGKHGCAVAHCPAAAMKMLGFCPVEALLEAGCPVALGTDGAPSNNRMNLLDEAYLASLLNKVRPAVYSDATAPTALPAEAVLEMATVHGAAAVLQAEDIGSLEAGKKADLVVIDLASVSTLPCHDLVGQLVSSCRSENVESVMVDGNWLMFDRRTIFPEAFVLERACFHAGRLVERAGITLAPRFNVVV